MVGNITNMDARPCISFGQIERTAEELRDSTNDRIRVVVFLSGIIPGFRHFRGKSCIRGRRVGLEKTK